MTFELSIKRNLKKIEEIRGLFKSRIRLKLKLKINIINFKTQIRLYIK